VRRTAPLWQPAAMTVTVVDAIADLRSRLDDARRTGRVVGLVPTMGYLHDGHLSLMERARDECDVVAVTIFVNPLQFAANEDLAGYPRDLERDVTLCGEVGADVVFAPDVTEMYPEPVLTTVSVAELGEGMEGGSRPTHFAGVATVVAKLFNIAGPCRAYFSVKDYQQLAIVTRMARDLSFPVAVVPCPILREPDGLAMSSRNVYLDAEQRAAAPVIHRALQAGAASVLAGETDPDTVCKFIAGIIEAEPLAELDYVDVVTDGTVSRPDPLTGTVRFLAAARVGRPRLIDNLSVTVPG
jgi:pantoate--beta-alanine ligase